jgi:hypothetical protein
MAGYSQTPLPKKLGIKEGHSVALAGAPGGFEATLGDLPPGATVGPPAANVDVALLFVTTREALVDGWGPLAEAIRPAGGLWVCWPKKASRVSTELTENLIRDFGLTSGLVDNKVCAVDETWSGLRFVYRLKDR